MNRRARASGARRAVGPGILAALALSPRPAYACAICFGAADSALLDAARLGVVVMVVVTLMVLSAFGRWFLKLRRLEEAQTPASREPDPSAQRPS